MAHEILTREDRLKPGLPSKIVLITDACSKEAVRPEASGVEVLRVGTTAGNLAITRFIARRSRVEAAKCEVLVEVRNQANQTAQGSVRLFSSMAGSGAGEGGAHSQKLQSNSPFPKTAAGKISFRSTFPGPHN